MAMLKLCNCGRTIPLGQARCESCLGDQKDRHKSYDKSKRDKVADAFYQSKDWKAVREQAMTRDNRLCKHCLKLKKIVPADMVDHIFPLKVSWELRLRLSNLQSLCNGCHNKKTAEDKKIFKGVMH